MYAGSGNKITIKRKSAVPEDTEQYSNSEGNQQSSVGSVKCISSSHLSYGSSQKKSSKSNKVFFHKFK